MPSRISKNCRLSVARIILSMLVVSSFTKACHGSLLELKQATIVTSHELSKPERSALRMLVEKIEKRTKIGLPTGAQWPEGTNPVIVLGRHESLNVFQSYCDIPHPSPKPAEGYQIQVQHRGEQYVVIVAGNDVRGVVFGVGHLLRSMQMSEERILIPKDLDIKTSPEYPLRGHQIGYRPKANSYDAWTPAMMEQYIRDLIVFGCNAIELIPPRSDDRPTSPHFPIPQLDMMIEMSQICDNYGIDVWIWYPALDEDYSDPNTVAFALKEWGENFKRLPRIDAILVPCGDPGKTPPELLLPMVARQAQAMKQYHSDVEWWLAPQGFGKTRLDTFYEWVNKRPAWLTGLVYGPGIRLTLAEFRRRTPAYYPIRHYPDITHSSYCQYPVPDWDLALSMIEGREVINPRPRDQATIFRRQQPHTIGFITYSEGCHDDVNKIIWSGLGWDSHQEVIDILRQYSRYFLGDKFEDNFSQGLLALEANWRGPLLGHRGVSTTYKQFRSMEQAFSAGDKYNWRFAMALFRATLDYAVYKRLHFETSQEEQALSILEQAQVYGSIAVLKQAVAILTKTMGHPVTDLLEQTLFEQAKGLYENIGLQLHTELYQAGRPDGAVLDRFASPLNNRLWLVSNAKRIQALPDQATRLAEIDKLLHWTDPGPGGFYDNLGYPGSSHRLVIGKGFQNDPSFFATAMNSTDWIRTRSTSFLHKYSSEFPLAWLNGVVGLYDYPVTMEYKDLDPKAHYRVEVLYGTHPIKLIADDTWQIHDFTDDSYQRLSYAIPKKATTNGRLTLSWYKPSGLGQYQMRHMVCEVWLRKVNEDR